LASATVDDLSDWLDLSVDEAQELLDMAQAITEARLAHARDQSTGGGEAAEEVAEEVETPGEAGEVAMVEAAGEIGEGAMIEESAEEAEEAKLAETEETEETEGSEEEANEVTVAER